MLFDQKSQRHPEVGIFWGWVQNRAILQSGGSPRPPEVGVSRWHGHTDGHGDSMTNSAQWGRVGENTCDT